MCVYYGILAYFRNALDIFSDGKNFHCKRFLKLYFSYNSSVIKTLLNILIYSFNRFIVFIILTAITPMQFTATFNATYNAQQIHTWVLRQLHLRETQLVLQLQTVSCIIVSETRESVVVTASYSELVLSYFQPSSPGSGNNGEGK